MVYAWAYTCLGLGARFEAGLYGVQHAWRAPLMRIDRVRALIFTYPRMNCVRAGFSDIPTRSLRAELMRVLFSTVANAGQTFDAVTDGRIENHARHRPLEALCFCARSRVGLVRRSVCPTFPGGKGGQAGVRLRLCMLFPAAVSLPSACVPPCACVTLRNGSRGTQTNEPQCFRSARKYIALPWDVFVQGLLSSRAPVRESSSF